MFKLGQKVRCKLNKCKSHPFLDRIKEDKLHLFIGSVREIDNREAIVDYKYRDGSTLTMGFRLSELVKA